MLPTALVSVYQQYKADTDALAGWLALTAKTAGCPRELLGHADEDEQKMARGRLKGKQRKLAKQAAAQASAKKIIVATDRFVPLAEFISTRVTAGVSVPQSIINLLDRAIHVRSTFSSRLSFHGAMPTPESDQSHSHFVEVLERVSAILHQVAKKHAPADDETNTQPIENRFQSLSLEEPSEAFLKAPDVDATSGGSDYGSNYESESPTTLEDALAAYGMLLEDLNKIRYEIKQIWTQYLDGSIDSAAAAIATNSGVDLGRYVIDQVVSIFDKHDGIHAVAERFSLRLAQQRGYSTEMLAEFYEVADETMLIANIEIHNRTCCKECADKHNRPWNDTRTYLDEVLHKTVGMIQLDSSILSKLLRDISAMHRTGKDFLVQDELMRGMNGIDRVDLDKVPFYLVFAAQLTIDIHHVLRQRAWEPAKQLLNELDYMDRVLQDSSRSDETRDSWCDCLGDLRDQIWRFQDDPFNEARRADDKIHGSKGPRALKHQTMWLSPVLCGLLLFYFRARVHDHGITKFHRGKNFKQMAHIYNALVQEGLIKTPWVDMEVAQSWLGDVDIFGGSRPSSKNAYLKQYLLDNGMAATSISDAFILLRGYCSAEPLKMTPRFRKKRPASRTMDKGIPVSSIFFKRYVDRSAGMDFRPEDINDFISRGRGFTSPDAVKARHSPDKLLQPLATALTAETCEFAFPRLLVCRLCGEVLTEIAKACQSLIDKIRGEGSTEMDQPLRKMMPWFLFSMLVRDEAKGRELLRMAADVVNEMVAEDAGKMAYMAMEMLGLSRGSWEKLCGSSKTAEKYCAQGE